MMKKKILFAFLIFGFIFSASFALAATVKFGNPIAADSVTELANSILTALNRVIAIIAIIMIVIGGMMYIFSAGDEKKMETAKNIITGAVAGLAIALAAPTFLREILDVFSGTPSNPDLVRNAPSLQKIGMKVLQTLLSIVGLFAMIGIVVGGMMYMTSYGDEKKMEKGKQIFVACIIGIAVALGALLLVQQVSKFF